MIVIWLKPDGTIYHKFVSGFYTCYFVGYKNSYDHEVIYIIDNLYNKYHRPPFKLRFKRKIINYIEKI